MSKKEPIEAPRGTLDLLPEEMPHWHTIEEEGRRLFETFGYREIRTPLMEDTALFQRGIGEGTDIVQKEMYSFADKGGRSLTLRPEGTASVVRAFIQHKLYSHTPLVKLYYCGPMFRYERPQRGRQRQFYQMGCEALGSSEPGIDYEVVLLAWLFFQRIGLKEITLKLNSLGCSQDKEAYSQTIREVLSQKPDLLCPDCQRRLETQAIRVLDCKNKECQEVFLSLPKPSQSLCEPCLDHFHTLQSYLKSSKVPAVIELGMVRGLDYYTRTVFEVTHPALGARAAVCGGGRYDDLVEELGGPSTPALGFAIGLEATILAMKEEGVPVKEDLAPSVFICTMGDGAKALAMTLLTDLRKEGIYAETDYLSKSLKASLRAASKRGTRWALIIGEEELKGGFATLKDLTSAEGLQSAVSMREVVSWVKKHGENPQP